MLYRISTYILALCICGIGGCGDDNPFSSVASALEGVYEIDTFTRNEEGCDDDGESVLTDTSNTHFYLKSSSIFGIAFVQAMDCESISACQEAADDGTGGIISFSYTFDSSAGEGQLSGMERSTGYSSQDNLCKSPRVAYAELTTISEDHIMIIKETHYGDDYPKPADDYCNTEDGYAASVGKPCSEREVLTGHRVSDL